MVILLKLLSTVFGLLFAEAILFIPVILFVAASGDTFGKFIKYITIFSLAVTPHIIWQRSKHLLSGEKRSIFLMVVCLIVGIFLLAGFSGVLLASCAGHPPL